LQDIPGHDAYIGKLLCQVLQPPRERRIQLNRVHRVTGGRQMLGHFAVPGSDLDPAVRVAARRQLGHEGLRRNADGARDLFPPVKIYEEVLAEALASHPETV
jgi:hypothetical protein